MVKIESSPMYSKCPKCKIRVLSYELVKNKNGICDYCIAIENVKGKHKVK